MDAYVIPLPQKYLYYCTLRGENSIKDLKWFVKFWSGVVDCEQKKRISISITTIHHPFLNIVTDDRMK